MSESNHTPSIFWFRRDLRLGDNPALLAAIEQAGKLGVVPVFVFDPQLWDPSGPARRAYLLSTLKDLDARIPGGLTVRHGNPLDVLPALAREVGASSVHIAADYGPYGAERDRRVEAALADDNVSLERLGSPYAVAPGRILKGDGTPYRVYTPFSKAWRQHGWRGPVPAPTGTWTADRAALASEPWPEAPEQGEALTLPTTGEEAALDRWHEFRDQALAGYRADRNRPDLAATSWLSPALKWGEIHPRTLLADLGDDEHAGPATFRKELAWREFYADVLHHNPSTVREYYQPRFAAMEYDEPGSEFEAWKQGRTGFPFVDAGMRQLLETGWMHNRVRMVAASFLVKDLHLEWQHGARHFMRHLIDGDVASNTHGWQWTAGCGTDAAPYFRVFNPTGQGEKFDPQARYIKRFVPELAGLTPEQIHGGEAASHADYPEPIVVHADERVESLRRLEALPPKQ